MLGNVSEHELGATEDAKRGLSPILPGNNDLCFFVFFSNLPLSLSYLLPSMLCWVSCATWRLWVERE